MHDNFWCKVEEDVFEKTYCEFEACPVMTVLENLESITVKVDISIEVHVVESFHRNLVLSAVFYFIGFVLKGKIMLDWTSWVLGLFILAWGEAGEYCPECEENGDSGDETKEDGSLESTTNLPGEV